MAESRPSSVALSQDDGTGARRMRWRRHQNPTVGPPCMKNHTATIYRNEVIVFGGFDGVSNNSKINVMNVETSEWRVVEHVEGVSPAGRNGHTATLANGKIFYIGGWLGAGPLGSGDVHTLDPITWTWSRVTTFGTGPGPCNMHTADYIEISPTEKYIFVFRGGDGHSYLNDLHMLDVDRLVWRRPQTKGRPPAPRANHSSAVFNKKLFIFGGWDGQARLHDLFILDAVKMTWSSPDTRGIPPTPRAGSTLTAVSNGLILFGGSGPHSSCFNDVHFFDPLTHTWHKAEKEYSPASKSLALATKRVKFHEPTQPKMVEDDNPNLQNQSTGISSRFTLCGDFPEKRAGHTATLVGNRHVLIIGGSFQTEYLRTVFELDIDPPPDLTIQSPHPAESLVVCLASYFNSEQFSDVTFKVEGESIFCHRLVLCSQSDWFRVMFQRGFQEATEKEIPIKNVPVAVFKQMIEFFYTGSIPLLSSSGFGIASPLENGGDASMNDEYAGILNMQQMNALDGEVLVDYTPQDGGANQSDGEGAFASPMRVKVPRRGPTSTPVMDMELRLSAVCDLLVVADQFMCTHLKERCEIALAHMVNASTVKLLLPFAKAHHTNTLLRYCEHYERWGGT